MSPTTYHIDTQADGTFTVVRVGGSSEMRLTAAGPFTSKAIAECAKRDLQHGTYSAATYKRHLLCTAK